MNQNSIFKEMFELDEKTDLVPPVMIIALYTLQNNIFGFMCEKVRKSASVSFTLKITLRMQQNTIFMNRSNIATKVLMNHL